MLENMAIQDIQNGNGMAFIDPHGKTAEKFLEYIPENRIKDVLYFAPFDIGVSGFFQRHGGHRRRQKALVVNGLMSTFKKIWVDAWSARMEYILKNTFLALLGISRRDFDRRQQNAFRQGYTGKKSWKMSKIRRSKSFWVDEFAKYGEQVACQKPTPAIQNKIGQFTSNPLVRNIVGQPKSSFDIRELMDKKKIMIINFSKGWSARQRQPDRLDAHHQNVSCGHVARRHLRERDLKLCRSFICTSTNSNLSPTNLSPIFCPRRENTNSG